MNRVSLINVGKITILSFANKLQPRQLKVLIERLAVVCSQSHFTLFLQLTRTAREYTKTRTARIVRFSRFVQSQFMWAFILNLLDKLRTCLKQTALFTNKTIASKSINSVYNSDPSAKTNKNTLKANKRRVTTRKLIPV